MTLTEDQLIAMLPDDRIAYIKGRTPDYTTKIDNAVKTTFARVHSDYEWGTEPETIRTEVITAFEQRVADYLNSPAGIFGGSHLDHLPQLGKISERFYKALYASAPGLAATIMEQAELPNMAKSAYQRFGKLEAKLRF